jgi:hypothetical protein
MGWQFAGANGAEAMMVFMRAMFGGMVILVLPAFAVCAGIGVMAYRRRDKFAGE